MAKAIPSLPHPSSPLVDASSRMTIEWFDRLDGLVKALQQRIPVTGTATFVAATSIAVTFATPEPNAEFNVHPEPVANRTYWVTGKTINGFTINASASNSDTVGWTMTRR